MPIFSFDRGLLLSPILWFHQFFPQQREQQKSFYGDTCSTAAGTAGIALGCLDLVVWMDISSPCALDVGKMPGWPWLVEETTRSSTTCCENTWPKRFLMWWLNGLRVSFWSRGPGSIPYRVMWVNLLVGLFLYLKLNSEQ